MNENLIEQLKEEDKIEINHRIISPIKIKFRFFTDYLKLFIILDIISFITTIIFLISSFNTFFWIFFSITILLTILVIISFVIICKEKKELKIDEIMINEEESNVKEKNDEIEYKEEREKKKEEIVERQKKYMSGEIKKENVKEVLEDMCVLGSIMKEEIIEEKKKNPEKFVSIEDATKEENKKNGTFCLGIVAQKLENMGITTAIEKNESNDENSIDASNTVLQFMMNGMIEKKKFDLHFDLGEERNEELLTNKKEQEKFNQKLRKKLSIEYNIPEDKIIITNAQRGSYRIQVIFENEDFNKKNIDFKTLTNNCNDNEFKELKYLKDVHTSLIMEGCKLTENMLDPRGNRESGWGEDEQRGGFDYFPPIGWIGFGLKVWDKYDNKNNDWLEYDGNSNEWAVAYHGIGCKLGSTVENATENIYKKGFKAGDGQAYENDKNDNPLYKKGNSKNDYSNLIGRGVYCSPNPDVMEEYAEYASTKAKANGKNYLMGFMMRVKPDKIRYSNIQKDYWVLDGTTEEMRPYRILIKEC